MTMYFLSGILAKMKEGAENVHTKLQAKAESVGLKPLNLDGKGQQTIKLVVKNCLVKLILIFVHIIII